MNLSTRTAPVLAAALAGGLAVAACGGSTAHSPAATTSAAPAGLTYSQGARICSDLNTWLAVAYNEDMPRFSAQMEADESQAEAANTALGSDLAILDSNLQSLNSVAFEPSPPGYSPPTGISALQQDCSDYGVNVQLPSS
jgi:hypothetical protein